MEILTAVLGPICSKIRDPVVESTKHQVRYILCFKSYVKDLREEHEKLRKRKKNVVDDVERAKRNAEIIEENVQEWLKDVDQVMKDVEELEEEMRANKTCLVRWCPNWGWRYGLSKKAEKKRNIMLNLQENSNFDRVSHRAPLPGIEFLAPQGFELFDSIKSTFDEIVEALRDDNIDMVGLHGMGGVGKTTLAKEVSTKVKELKIFDEVVMVIVSQYSVQHIQDQIADSLDLKFEKQTKRAEELYLRFTMSEKKIFIILDDIWEKIDLKTTIGIPLRDGHKGHCKVLVTTRSAQVCIDMNCQRKIQLKTLNEKEGLNLFKKHASIGDSPTLNALAIEVVRECKGLPLALVAMGGALREKGIDEYKVIFQKLKKSKLEDIPYSDVDLYACLKLSYDNLKSKNNKLCFLLCSLFPEDYIISLEDLVIYGINLGLYDDADTIEEARSQLRVIVKELKACCLLLDADTDRSVKMHDIVRDIALCIASKDKKFLGKAGIGLTEWPRERNMEQYEAISLIQNDVEVLPNGLKYPNLRILLLSIKSFRFRINVLDQFFEEIKALEVLTLGYGVLSLKSLQFLTNLQILKLESCSLTDISFLGQLDKIEILSLQNSIFDELPGELGNLSKLRLLNLSYCSLKKKWIPSNVIRKLSQLEEFYIAMNSHLFSNYERGSEVITPMMFSEFYSLTRLVVLTMDTKSWVLQKDIAFRKFQRYDITVNQCIPRKSVYPEENSLRIDNVEVNLLTIFKALYQTLKHLHLGRVMDCQNIHPRFDEGGLNELKTLHIKGCNKLEYVIDMTQQQSPASVFSKLEILSLERLSCLKEICYGGNFLGGLLEKLKKISVIGCPNINRLLPISIAQGFVQLEELTLSNAPNLKQVFYLDCVSEDIVVEGAAKNIVLPKLRVLTFDALESFTSFLPENFCSTLPALEELRIWECSSLNTSFNSQVKMPNLSEKLQIIDIEDCHHELWDGLMLTCPRLGFKKLERLEIKGCGINIRRCNKFKYLFPITIVQSLQKLEYIALEDISQLEEIFGQGDGAYVLEDKEIVLPQLKELSLKALPSLTNFCPNGYQFILTLESLRIEGFHKEDPVWAEIFTCLRVKKLYIKDCEVKELEGLCKDSTTRLQNLTYLDFTNCSQLRHIFSPTLAKCLSQLQELYVWDCGDLEQIIVEDDDTQPLLFPSLSKINVRRCNKLKCVFPITIARGLQQLKQLFVRENFELEEVFGERDGGKVMEMDGKAIVLPELYWLSLGESPRLTNFCPVGYHFIFPSLKNDGTLFVKGCDKIATRFSVDEKQSVHAEGKPPKDDEECITDICCQGSRQLRATLPPYIEQITTKGISPSRRET